MTGRTALAQDRQRLHADLDRRVPLFVAVSVLFFILGYLVYHGGKSHQLELLHQAAAPVGETGGGMANAIVGSGKLLAARDADRRPDRISGRRSTWPNSAATRFAFVVRYTADLLNGVPSIVIGIFAYAMVVLPFKHFSTLAGGIALGVMMIPITLRSTEEFLRAVPRALREGRHGTGREQVEDDRHRDRSGGLPGHPDRHSAGVRARRRGNRSSAFHRVWQSLLESRVEPADRFACPVMIYTYAISPYDDWHRQAWAAGLVLLGLILVVNIVARAILARGVAVPRS